MKTLLAAFVLTVTIAPTAAWAQWIKYPHAGVPRNPDGSVNLTAPAPRTTGHTALTGLWRPVTGAYVDNIARDLGVDKIPFQPWAKQLYEQRRATLSKEDPTGWCVPGGVPRSDAVPYPFQILESPGEVVILYEAVLHFRQIFTDGRALPTDPNPQWLGYSTGHWEGDTFVAESAGFRENAWLDNWGLPGSDALRVTEKFQRRDFGHMDIEITINDPKAYTAPWTVKLPTTLVPDTELLEYICAENNKDLEHLVGK